jgi:nitrate/TMAO reductase-like tetraheme cytochrome c subunit
MDEEHKDITLAAPPRFRGRLIKILTLTLFFLIVLFSVGFLGLETTSSSKFCASCHEMKPEYYTWKASSHSEVACVNCHTGSTTEEYAKAKATGLVQVFKKATQSYTAPIRMPDQIRDASCEKCHNIFTRDVTPSGDLIIPHDKHKKQGIQCAQCHQGVAHGKIADRKMTYQADYGRWDEMLGRAVMSEPKFIKPDMETCMECHKLRKAPLECTACHTTGMYPESHQRKDFKAGVHGSHAQGDLLSCNQCHKDMSREEVTGFEEVPSFTKFLKKGQDEKKKNEKDYAKENTFCRDCHSTRPVTHTNNFMTSHGVIAKNNIERCTTCHEYQQKSDAAINIPACANCHPSSHNKPWRDRHPVILAPSQKLEQSCYTCHNPIKCSACHVEVQFEQKEEPDEVSSDENAGF